MTTNGVAESWCCCCSLLCTLWFSELVRRLAQAWSPYRLSMFASTPPIPVSLSQQPERTLDGQTPPLSPEICCTQKDTFSSSLYHSYHYCLPFIAAQGISCGLMQDMEAQSLYPVLWIQSLCPVVGGDWPFFWSSCSSQIAWPVWQMFQSCGSARV